MFIFSGLKIAISIYWTLPSSLTTIWVWLSWTEVIRIKSKKKMDYFYFETRIPAFLNLVEDSNVLLKPSKSKVVNMEVLQQLWQAQAGGGGGAGGGRGFIPGKAGVDYPDFKTIPATDFTCENFLLPGFYADTFTSCQVTGNRHLVKNSTMTNVFGQALAQTWVPSWQCQWICLQL